MRKRINEAQIERFIANLKRGQDNAIRADQLCRRLGLTPRNRKPSEDDKRLIRYLASAARRSGHFFAGDDSGYYVPKSRHEALPCLLRIERQAKTMLKAAKNYRSQMADEFDGQGKIEF